MYTIRWIDRGHIREAKVDDYDTGIMIIEAMVKTYTQSYRAEIALWQGNVKHHSYV